MFFTLGAIYGKFRLSFSVTIVYYPVVLRGTLICFQKPACICLRGNKHLERSDIDKADELLLVSLTFAIVLTKFRQQGCKHIQLTCT